MKYRNLGTTVATLILVTSLEPVFAQDAGPECRGVAAGVVAAMRSSGEITSQEASEAAVVAARRACEAALGELGVSAEAPAAEDSTQASAGEEDKSVWDFLTRDVEKKPGNERLRRLRQF